MEDSKVNPALFSFAELKDKHLLIVCTENAHAELTLIPKVIKTLRKLGKFRESEGKEEIPYTFIIFFSIRIFSGSVGKAKC